jgi:hypothetical protein
VPEGRYLGFFLGIGGTAISALTTVKLVTAGGAATPFVVTAIVLAAYALLAALLLCDAPDRVVPAEPLSRRLVATARLRIRLVHVFSAPVGYLTRPYVHRLPQP